MEVAEVEGGSRLLQPPHETEDVGPHLLVDHLLRHLRQEVAINWGFICYLIIQYLVDLLSVKCSVMCMLVLQIFNVQVTKFFM